MTSEKIPGDPNSLAGESEHSQQVALFAALAQYEYGFRLKADDALASCSEVERLLKLADALKWVHSIPNGGSRGNDKRSAMIQGANLKAEGQKRGVSDICINVARQGYRCFYIEMKAPGVGKWVKKRGLVNGNEQLRGEGMNAGKVWDSGESDEQIEFGKWIASEGGLYAVFYGWSEALKAVMWYLGFEHDKQWSID